MRITQNISYNTFINDIMRRQENVYDLNKQISTGKRVNAPSDDPVKAKEIISAKGILKNFEQYERNIDSGLSYLSTAEGALDTAKDVLSQIQEIAVNHATGTSEPSARLNAANVVSNLYDQLVSVGNTTIDNKYVFSGFKTGTQAFTSTGAYQGDANKQQIRINTNSTMNLGLNGGEIFKGTAGGVDIMQGVADLKTALETNDAAGIQASIGTLEASFDQISGAVADIGGRVSRLTTAKDDFSNSKLELRSQISVLEDADITQVISDLKLSQVALEAAMSSAGKVFSINIFDYL